MESFGQCPAYILHLFGAVFPTETLDFFQDYKINNHRCKTAVVVTTNQQLHILQTFWWITFHYIWMQIERYSKVMQTSIQRAMGSQSRQRES